jgi:hypothetical protein
MSIGDLGTGKKLKSFSLFGENFEFARAEPVFQFPNIYSNTFPPPSAILYWKMSSITLFFFQMNIIDMIQLFMY